MSFSLGGVRGVILDIDGVLLDARASYHAVAEEAARRAIAPLVGAERARSVAFDRHREVPAFKAAGGFNDDWEMSRAIALLLYLRSRDEAPELADFLAGASGRGVSALYARRPIPIPAATVARICGALYAGSKCGELFGFEATEAIPDAPEKGMWEKEEVLPDLFVDMGLPRRLARKLVISAADEAAFGRCCDEITRALTVTRA